MLIHPWDAAISDTEWRDWPAGHDFGQLAVNDPHNGAPHVIPTHFAADGDTLLVHLARPKRRWPGRYALPGPSQAGHLYICPTPGEADKIAS